MVSYLTARPSRDIVRLARQELTRQWWVTRGEYDLVISALVVEEVSRGDQAAADLRLAALDGVPELEITRDVLELADRLTSEHALPAKAQVDAMHVAVAAVHGVEFLVTWNCRHIANAMRRGDIERTCEASGFAAPIICTPEEFGVGGNDEYDG